MNLKQFYSVRIRKTGRYKEITDKAKAKNNKENIKFDSSIISQNIHGKYSRSMVCETWKFTESSEDDFTVVSLQIPSCREVNVHVKFYPAEPIDRSIMIDYDFKFERYNNAFSFINFTLIKINKQNLIK